MKSIVPLLAIILSACATTAAPQTAVVIDNNDYIPRKDFELILANTIAKESSPHTQEVVEHIQYENSIARINKQFEDEQLQLTMCEEQYHSRKHNVCIELKNHLCEVDMFLDSRGDHHMKIYCTP
jgi:hypothetical protein